MAENILNRFENIYDEEPELDLTKKVKVGIIGTGWIAEEHIRGYREMPDVEIVAAADLVLQEQRPGRRPLLRERSRNAGG